MLKRRNIREAAIQFLYFKALSGNDTDINADEDFWNITQESSLNKLNSARAKAILHVTEGRDNRLNKLNEQSPAAFTLLKATNDSTELASTLKKIIAQQKTLSKCVDQLKTTLKSKGADSTPAELIDLTKEANRVLPALYNNWHELLKDIPQLTNKLEAITAAINHLSKASNRLDAIDDPNSSLTDFAHLRSSDSEIKIARKTIKELVENVLHHQVEIDQLLSNTIENFQPERVDLVDRSILQLAVYEINYCDDIPRSVSINEAIEIAKRFGTTESSRFVNGVLDSLPTT